MRLLDITPKECDRLLGEYILKGKICKEPPKKLGAAQDQYVTRVK